MMQVIKLYPKPDKPEYYKVVRVGELGLLVNYPIDKPDRKREAKWLSFNALSMMYVDWIKTFDGE
jgi:hypothetical protein